MRVVSALFLLSSCFFTCATARSHRYSSALRGRGNRRRLANANDLPWIAPSFSIGEAGLAQTLPSIDTSGAVTVLASVSLSAAGTLESSGDGMDTMQIYYKVDTNPEVLWKNITGADFLAQESISIPAGNQLTLRLEGRTSHAAEVYFLSNFQVFDPDTPLSTKSPVAAPLPSQVATAEPTATPSPTALAVPQVCGVPKVGPM